MMIPTSLDGETKMLTPALPAGKKIENADLACSTFVGFSVEKKSQKQISICNLCLHMGPVSLSVSLAQKIKAQSLIELLMP